MCLHLFKRVIIIIGSLLLCSCSKDLIATEHHTLEDAGMQKRVGQIAGIQWRPKGQIPMQGGVYQSDETVNGIPYSSVKEMERFVGQNVSFYTFMTAVANPKSVLYTETVNKAPYHGTNCSTYYGTVCSMAVNYVLGIPYLYTTSDYKNLEDFMLVQPQSIDYAQPYDILLQEGKHVVMITELISDENNVSEVQIFESSGGKARTRVDKYSRDQLLTRWKRDVWELLRYKNLNQPKVQEVIKFNEYPYNTTYESPLCCSRGDRATFRKGEEIVLNNLDGSMHKVSVKRNGKEVEVVESSTDMHFSELEPGTYTFDLSNASWNNPMVEVLGTSVSAERYENELVVTFSSINATPTSLIISDIRGVRYLVKPIDIEDITAERKTVTIPNRSDQLYLKVLFEGQFGSVSNEPIKI